MAKKGEKISYDYKKKISEGRRRFYINGGIHNWLGKKLSKKTKEIISQKALGNKRGLGNHHTLEFKKKIKNIMLGNKHGRIHGLSKTKEYKRKKGHKAALKSYGLTLEDYELLVKKQQKLCAICKKSSKRKLGVDHNHKTGIVRGLLCVSCNMALGMFKDNLTFLKRAIKYLKNYAKSR